MSTQNVNVARFARNLEWDFFCDFQTPLKKRRKLFFFILANYYEFQAAMDRTTTEVIEDPSKSSYALKLVKENESLKGKLAQLESSAPMCFHGKHLPPNSASSPSCQDDVRACIEQSHANFQHQQSHIKSQVIFLFFSNLYKNKNFVCFFRLPVLQSKDIREPMYEVHRTQKKWHKKLIIISTNNIQ